MPFVCAGNVNQGIAEDVSDKAPGYLHAGSFGNLCVRIIVVFQPHDIRVKGSVRHKDVRALCRSYVESVKIHVLYIRMMAGP